jgi:hypothetical protein
MFRRVITSGKEEKSNENPIGAGKCKFCRARVCLHGDFKLQKLGDCRVLFEP